MILKVSNQKIYKKEFIKINELDKEVFLAGYFFYNDILYDRKNIKSFFNNNISTDCFKYLNGFFNLIIICNKTKEINIYNDRVGAIGLYYHSSSNEIIISDEIKQLTSITNEIDEISMMEMLRFRFTSGKYTIYKNIFKISPASNLTISLKSNLKLNISRYWDYSFNIKNKPLEQVEKEGYDILMSVTKRYNNNFGNKPLGLFLSGGFDSRAILGLMMKNNFTNIKTFSYGHDDCDDIIIAKKINQYYGLNSEILSDNTYCSSLFNKREIYNTIEKIGHTSYYMQGLYNQILLSRLNDIEHIALGDPGFILGIYLSKFDNQIADDQALTDFIFKKNRTGLTSKEISVLMNFTYTDQEIEESLRNRIIESTGSNNDYKILYYKWIQENRFRNYILTSQIDIMIKAGKKIFSPLYDNDFIDYLFSLPPEYYKNYKVYLNILGKHIFTDKFKVLSEIKYDSRGYYKLRNQNYSPTIKNKRIKSLVKLKNKITGKYQKNDLYPLLMLRNKNKTAFNNNINNLMNSESNIFNMKNVKELTKKNISSKFGLKYKVLIILSAILTEQYINDEIQK